MNKKFEYNWENNEANFGPPVKNQVDGGTHINFEIILKKEDKYVALRRQQAIPEHEMPPQAKNQPNGRLYYGHNLIRYGESVEECIKRIVRSQAGVSIKSFKILDIESVFQKKDSQWAFTPYILAELKELPKPGDYGNKITEIITFDKNNIPEDFGWWTKKELKEFLWTQISKNE